MRINLNITVEVDSATWELEYGVSGSAAIREDVRAYVRTLLEGNGNLEVVYK